MNLSNIVSVKTRNGEFQIENTLTKDEQPIYVSGRRTAWKESLLKALSRYCGCTFMTEKDFVAKTTQYFLVSRRYNIAKMRALWNWLLQRLQDNAKLEVVGSGRIAINSYCIGFVEGLEKSIDKSNNIGAAIHSENEAKHYMRLTHYEVQEAPECNNSNIDVVALEQGFSRGSLINLDAVTTHAGIS